jgi:hypothetical protein
MPDPLADVVRAMFVDIDTDDALAVLDKMGLPVAYSEDAVNAVNAAANKLADDNAALKLNGAPRDERKAIAVEVDRLVNARSFLYRLRPASPGDVTVSPAPVGGKG